MNEAFDVLQTRNANGGGITGMPTGYTEFDEMTAGLQPTDLLILAARPAMGKTTLALNIAEYAAIKTKKGVAVFSMERSASQLALRLISSNGRGNATRLRNRQDPKIVAWGKSGSVRVYIGDSLNIKKKTSSKTGKFN